MNDVSLVLFNVVVTRSKFKMGENDGTAYTVTFSPCLLALATLIFPSNFSFRPSKIYKDPYISVLFWGPPPSKSPSQWARLLS